MPLLVCFEKPAMKIVVQDRLRNCFENKTLSETKRKIHLAASLIGLLVELSILSMSLSLPIFMFVSFVAFKSYQTTISLHISLKAYLFVTKLAHGK